MALAHYDASLAYDQAVGRGLPGQLAKVTDKEDVPVGTILDLNGSPISVLVSNSQGYVQPFQVDNGPAFVKLSIGHLSYFLIDLNLVGASAEAAWAAAADANDARLAAQEAARLVGAPADEVVETLVANPSSLTGTALSAAIGESVGRDFVATMQRISPYRQMFVRKANSVNGLEISCITRDRHVTYQLTEGPRYRIIGDIWIGPVTWAYARTGTHAYVDGTKTGTWVEADTPYTTVVGSTWSEQIATKTPNALVKMTRYTDDRGGIFRVELLEVPGSDVQISSWSSSATNIANGGVLAVPTPGNYTVQFTFLGDDPAHPPSSGAGTSRGWMSSVPAMMTVDESAPTITKETRIAPRSNRDIAVRAKRAGATYTPEFMPYHGTETEVQVTEPVFYDGDTVIDIAGMATLGVVPVETFDVVQHIQGIHPSEPGTPLIDITTRHTFRADGTCAIDGQVVALTNLEAAEIYTGMFPGENTVMDEFVGSGFSGFGVAPPTAQETTYFPEPKGTASYAFLSATKPSAVAAMTVRNPSETWRVTGDRKRPPALTTFLNNRTDAIAKLYSHLYDAGAIISSGERHKFSVDYWHGESPGAQATLTEGA